MSKTFTSETYDEGLVSKNYAKNVSSEDNNWIKIHQVAYFCHSRVLHDHSHLWCHR